MPLSQVGFSAIDFFGLIPSVYLLLFHLASKLLRVAFRLFLMYLVIPLVFYIIAWLIAENYGVVIFEKSLPLLSFVSFAGTISWMAGFLWGFSSYINKGEIPRWSWIISSLGALLLGLSIKYINTYAPATSSANSGATETNIFLEIGAFFVLSFVFILPYYMGLYLAQLSVNERVLSKVQRIVFKTPLEISGMIQATNKKSAKTKDNKTPIFAYEMVKDRPVYLISMFSKNTALFAPQETIGGERGKLIIISNDEIRSMEINSGVTEKALYAK